MKNNQEMTASATIEPGSATIEVPLKAPFQADFIRLEGDLTSFVLLDILVDGVSQLDGKILWRTLYMILGPAKMAEISAEVLENDTRLFFDTAKRSLSIEVKNVSPGKSRLAVVFRSSKKTRTKFPRVFESAC